jgi:16S rRNA (cytidine1402-2'-O)-methyltransferase
MTGALVLVPNTLDLGAAETPIEDVLAAGTIRRAARLRFWAAEDARSARAFLKRVAAVEPLVCPLQDMRIAELPRPRKGSGQPVAAAAWATLLQPTFAGDDVGLVSEAGLPAIADPGAALVLAAHEAGVPVLPLVGASSLLLAMAASGLNGQSFAFVGYLPQDAAARLAKIDMLQALSVQRRQTQLVIETPYRNSVVFNALVARLAPNTWLAVACGLTLPGGWSVTRRVAAWRLQPPTWPERYPAVFGLMAS